jgi:hypothetical protein
MKYFTDGDKILGSATSAKRYLRDNPNVATVQRYWWYGNDLIECEDYTREQILGETAHTLTQGETAQWAHDHGRFSQ